MAVPFLTPTSTSYLHSGIGLPPPAPRAFVGFKHQSPGPFRIAKPNSHFGYRTNVISSTQFRTNGSKPTRGRIKMMLQAPLIKRKMPRGGRDYEDLWSLLEGERIFIICEDIDQDLSDELHTLLLHFDGQNSEKPFLFIFNCLGGEVNPCLQIYDTMQYLESPIATHCVGTAANMAAFLLAAGDKGKRTATPHSMIVLQPIEGVVDGLADDATSEVNELIRVRNYIFNQFAIKTGHPVEKVQKDLANSRTFSAEEAVEYGLIDRIIRPPHLNPDPSKGVPSELRKYY